MKARTHTITHIDGGDWHWYYIDGDLASEGPEGISNALFVDIVIGLRLSDIDIVYEYVFIDTDLAERAWFNADTLDKLFELGLELRCEQT